MTTYDFNTKFTTEFVDNYGTKIMFNPLHNKNEGSMITTRPTGQEIGGTYNLREENNLLYLGWYGKEFLFRPTEVGFDLFSGETLSYSYTKVQ